MSAAVTALIAALRFGLAHWQAIAAAVLVAITLRGFYHAGQTHERARWVAAQTQAAAQARNTERAGDAIAQQAETAALARASVQQEKADAEINQLRVELARHRKDLDGCRVSRAVVRVLDGGAAGVPATAAAAAFAGAAAADVAPDTRGADRGTTGEPHPHPAPPLEGEGTQFVSVQAVLENAAWNRLNTCEANAAQVRELQAFYAAVRERFNRP